MGATSGPQHLRLLSLLAVLSLVSSVNTLTVQGKIASPAATDEPPCVITTYTVRTSSLMEYRYTMTTIMAAISHHCRCHIQLRDRSEAVQGIRNLATYRQPAMILIAVRGLMPEEQQAVEEAGIHALKLVVMHQSDEYGQHDVSWYPKVKAVFRNYHRDLNQLSDHTKYLASAVRRRLYLTNLRAAAAGVAPPDERQNVFWYPLGFGDFFVPSQAMQLDLTSRPLLWSWTGSTKGKPERIQMIAALNSSEVMKHGMLYAFPNFKSALQLPPVQYTSLLYESKLVPLPPGMHAEQFRLWEAIIAGAIPMALKKHADGGLAHATILQLKVLWLDSWADAPGLMMEVLTNEPMQRELTAWQEHNSRSYVRIMRSVQQQMAIAVCNPIG